MKREDFEAERSWEKTERATPDMILSQKQQRKRWLIFGIGWTGGCGAVSRIGDQDTLSFV